MKTGHKRLTGRAAALLALALMAGHAAASQSWDVSQACGQAHRIDRATATCLNGAWDNSPGLWSGYAGGSDHWVQSVCSNHGLVYASVDIAGQLDKKYKLDNAAKQTSISLTSNVRAIACCINHGDQLCFKNQVEKNASWEIRHVTVSGSGYSETTTDVSTHAKRYKFCQDHPNDIYCKVNPEGDALTNPYNCGDHFCTAADCTWHWERSDALRQLPVHRKRILDAHQRERRDQPEVHHHRAVRERLLESRRERGSRHAVLPVQRIQRRGLAFRQPGELQRLSQSPFLLTPTPVTHPGRQPPAER